MRRSVSTVMLVLRIVWTTDSTDVLTHEDFQEIDVRDTSKEQNNKWIGCVFHGTFLVVTRAER